MDCVRFVTRTQLLVRQALGVVIFQDSDFWNSTGSCSNRQMEKVAQIQKGIGLEKNLFQKLSKLKRHWEKTPASTYRLRKELMFFRRRLRIKQTEYTRSDDILKKVETIGKCTLTTISIRLFRK